MASIFEKAFWPLDVRLRKAADRGDPQEIKCGRAFMCDCCQLAVAEDGGGEGAVTTGGASCDCG
jgi:hypothetical protein